MKVIFLDVDGVLNDNDRKKPKVQEDKVKLLKEIAEKTEANLVLSSDWRYWWDKPDEDFILLVEMLRKFGMELISKTPITRHGYRGAEIYQWMNEWRGEQVEKFVIIDDCDDMKPYMDRLVQTLHNQGLAKIHVEKAIKLLDE